MFCSQENEKKQWIKRKDSTLGCKIQQGRDNDAQSGNQEGTKGVEETRGQRDTGKTLNEREMGS